MAEDRQLVESISKIANHLADIAPPKKVSHFEYMRARKKRVKLSRQVYMSGVKIRENQLTEEQIRLLNKLKPGKYNDGKWTVIERDASGLEGGAIDIFLRNKSNEDRMQLLIEAPSLDVLCTKIIAEQEAKENARRRPVTYNEPATT